MTDDADRDDAERLRRRQSEADAEATRTPPPPGRGAACVIGSVLTSGGASGVLAFRMRAQVLTGTEAEGSAGVLTDAGWEFFAVNLGSAAPAAGTNVLCTFSDFRWVFRYQ